jgi:SAM-dependent methyltransferase
MLIMFSCGVRYCHPSINASAERNYCFGKGRVLEIGIGTGANLPFYSEQVTEIVGIEPDPAMLKKARTSRC